MPDQQNVIVTGGSGGIGAAICHKFASAGYNIILHYNGNHEKAQAVVESCRGYDVQVLLVQGDLSYADVCQRIVEESIAAFGQIHVLVNNAGITRDNLILRMREEDFDQVISTNLKSAWLMMKEVSKHMLKKRAGRIINISSVVGVNGNAGQTNYAASKAGLIGLTKSLAKEVASRGITVNAVAPGFITTDMTAKLDAQVIAKISEQIPLRTMGTVEDVAGAVAFLASNDAKYITGHVLTVDGGMSM